MYTEKIIPISWEEWDKNEELNYQFYEVEFMEDFGIFKAGEKCEVLSINYSEGIINVYDDEGEKLKEQKFKIVPLP